MTSDLLTPVDTAPTPELDQRVESVLPVVHDQARIVDDQACFPGEGLAVLRRSGLLGLLVPTEFGGLGGTVPDLVRVADRLAGECLSTAMIWAMHCQQVATLVAHATPGLRARLLPRIAHGEVYVASVTSERGKGGHLLTSKAPLTRTGGALHIERDAPIVTGGLAADGFLITMQDGGDTDHGADGRVSLVYADRADLRLTTSGSWNPMGMRGTHSVAMRIAGTVPADQLVGVPGDFRTAAVDTFAPIGHIAWAACWLGAARGALGSVLDLLRGPAGRKRFDLGSDLLRTRIARVRMELDVLAALVAQCVRDIESGGDLAANPVQLRLNALKVVTAERSHAAVDQLIEITGLRHGYLRDSPLALERTLRDLRSASLNYSNDRLLLANGALALLDRRVTLAY
ncbi:MAG TPA: acyl-CoA dehydrogenase family protein [Pseudonocardiaceae bacterium]|jgi:acyl-CoA dehydrogenase